MLLLPLVLAALSVQTGPSADAQFRFTDVTAASGIEFTTQSGTLPHTQILEVDGSGLGLIDHDGDGDLDLFIANGATLDDPEHGPGSRLYENLGDLTFRDITTTAGINHTRWTMGVTVADYDADGHDDLYLTCYGPNVLLRNVGDGTFEDVSEAAGVADPGWGTGCAFGDIDGDGDLDLYVVNYVRFDTANPPPPSTFKGMKVLAGPKGLPAQADTLCENRGDGTFADISESSGIRAVRKSFGLGVLIFDANGDGAQDIYVGNDSQANFLFLRGDDGRFHDHGLRSGISSNMDGSDQATMGIAVSDVDGNGTPDVFTTNFSSDTNTLFLNDPGGKFFDDGTSRFGLGMISRPYLGWACGFYDFDLDGDEDLLFVNGHVYPQASRETMDSDYEQPPLLFEHDGRRFKRVTDGASSPFLAQPRRDRAVVWGDLDNDGDIDQIISGINDAVRVIRNDSPRRGAWTIVELDDNRPDAVNRRGLGAMIKLEVEGSDRAWRRWLTTGGSFQSSNAQYAHFGVPASELGTRPIATLTITWPDGITEIIGGVPLDAHIVVPRVKATNTAGIPAQFRVTSE